MRAVLETRRKAAAVRVDEPEERGSPGRRSRRGRRPPRRMANTAARPAAGRASSSRSSGSPCAPARRLFAVGGMYDTAPAETGCE